MVLRGIFDYPKRVKWLTYGLLFLNAFVLACWTQSIESGMMTLIMYFLYSFLPFAWLRADRLSRGLPFSMSLRVSVCFGGFFLLTFYVLRMRGIGRGLVGCLVAWLQFAGFYVLGGLAGGLLSKAFA